MAEQSGMSRLESFPFDSKADGYDADGYPVYDRAVGARMLRKTFEQFFTDGVFGKPADALQIAKGESGLYITIKPGIFIIKGAMGGVIDDDLSILLDTAAPQGNIAYGVMLHYDETDAAGIGRSLSIRIVRGSASASPQPPAPDQSSPGVYEYRLGYVTVPSGATDLSAAVVTNEKGTGVCPYAAPFEEIDLSDIVEDARNQAQEVTDAFLVYAQQYYDIVASAIDDTTAGYLMEMINNISAASFVDNVTLNLNGEAKAQVKDNSITGVKIVNYSIEQRHLDNYLRQLLGILDTSDWDFNQYLSYVQGLSAESDQRGFMTENLTAQIVGGWTTGQKVQFAQALKGDSARVQFIGLIDLNLVAWSEVSNLVSQFASALPNTTSSFIGKTKSASAGSFGTFNAIVFGINHDSKAGGGSVPVTFGTDRLIDFGAGYSVQSATGYAGSAARDFVVGTVYNQLDSAIRSACVEAVKKSAVNADWHAASPLTVTSNDRLSIISLSEWTQSTHAYGDTLIPGEGLTYAYLIANRSWMPQGAGGNFNTRTYVIQYGNTNSTSPGNAYQGGTSGMGYSWTSQPKVSKSILLFYL